MSEYKNTEKTYGTERPEPTVGHEVRAPYRKSAPDHTMVRLYNGLVISYETYMQDSRGWNGID